MKSYNEETLKVYARVRGYKPRFLPQIDISLCSGYVVDDYSIALKEELQQRLGGRAVNPAAVTSIENFIEYAADHAKVLRSWRNNGMQIGEYVYDPDFIATVLADLRKELPSYRIALDYLTMSNREESFIHITSRKSTAYKMDIDSKRYIPLFVLYGILRFNPVPIIGKNSKQAEVRCYNKCKEQDFADRFVNGACLTFVTGESSGFIVIDIDTHEEDEKKVFTPIDKYILDMFSKINTPAVRTARGGYHLYFHYDEEINKQSNRLKVIRRGGELIPACFDVKTGGSTVPAPPSVRFDKTCSDLTQANHTDGLTTVKNAKLT